MKNTIFQGLAVCAGLFAAGALGAQEAPRGVDRAAMREKVQARMQALRGTLRERLDAARPGAPGPRERMAPRGRFAGRGPVGPQVRERIKRRIDTDGDGAISQAERTAWREKVQAQRAKLRERFDAARRGAPGPRESRAPRGRFPGRGPAPAPEQ